MTGVAMAETLELPSPRLVHVTTDGERRALGAMIRECPRHREMIAASMPGRARAAAIKAAALAHDCGFLRHYYYPHGTRVLCIMAAAADEMDGVLETTRTQDGYDNAITEAALGAGGR